MSRQPQALAHCSAKAFYFLGLAATFIMTDIYSQLQSCQSDVSRLRQELNKLASEKEAQLAKVRSHKADISSLVQKIKSSKEQRDKLTAEVKSLKAEIPALEEKLESGIAEFREARKQKAEIMEKVRFPDAIKRQIAELESKIETEVISFGKEQEIMKVLKQKKKELAEAVKVIPLSEREKSSSSSISELKPRLNGLRAKIKSLASESQRHHEAMIESVNTLKELRALSKESFEKFSEVKKAFAEINSRLKARLDEFSALRKQLDEQKTAARKENEQRKEKLIEDKQAELKEKMMKGGKLTAKDLVFFQGDNQ